MECLLVTSYYKDEDKNRQEELDKCLQLNCMLFDRVIILIDDHTMIPPLISDLDSVDRMILPNRPTFKDAFNAASRNNPDGLNFVANTDIYFREQDLDIMRDRVDWEDVSLALSRMDELSDGTLVPWHKPDSQDAWVFKGELYLDEDAEFQFGRPGCDNRIAHIMSETTEVFNPCQTINCYHVHNTQKRNYTRQDQVKGKYQLVHPCFFSDLQPEQFFGFNHKSRGFKRTDAIDYRLTIMIPTIRDRRESFQKLVKELFRQIEKGGFEKNVQIVKCSNEELNIPQKRNVMLDRADGEYVVSIDDDDDVPKNYIKHIMHGINFDTDCITFKGEVTVNGGNPRDYIFDIDQKNYEWVKGDKYYRRPPGHLTPIKARIAKQFKYKEGMERGSDVEWSLDIVKSGLLKSCYHIDKYLYFYNRLIKNTVDT